MRVVLPVVSIVKMESLFCIIILKTLGSYPSLICMKDLISELVGGSIVKDVLLNDFLMKVTFMSFIF